MPSDEEHKITWMSHRRIKCSCETWHYLLEGEYGIAAGKDALLDAFLAHRHQKEEKKKDAK